MKKTYFVLALILVVAFWTLPSLLGQRNALAEAKIDVVVDFTGYSIGNIVTFTDDKNKTTVFDSANGVIQTEHMKQGLYSILWSINPSTPSACQVYFPYVAGSELVLPEVVGSTSVDNVDLVTFYGGFNVNCR